MLREIWYEVNRRYLRLMLTLFYKRIDITGMKDFPKKTPIMFAPNHQNAFMDALMIVSFNTKKIWFLTRADIFKKPLAIFLLNSLRMTPIYRQRDGVDSLEKNKAVFRKCYEDFDKGECILIFPEGNHQSKRTLRPITKGTTRIAFGYETEMGMDRELAVIPSGITYSEPTRFNGSAKVVFNTPIYLQDYIEVFKDKPQVAMRKLTAKIKEELDAAMLNIPEDHYKTVDVLLRLDDSIFNNHDVEELQAIAEKMTEKLNEDEQLADDLRKKIEHMPVLKTNRPNIFKLFLSLVFLPFFIPALIAYPYHYIIKKILKKANDQAFKSSLKLGITMYVGIPYLAIVGLLAVILLPGIPFKIISVLFIAFSYRILMYYFDLVKKLRNWKFYPLRKELLKVRKQLLA